MATEPFLKVVLLGRVGQTFSLILANHIRSGPPQSGKTKLAEQISNTHGVLQHHPAWIESYEPTMLHNQAFTGMQSYFLSKVCLWLFFPFFRSLCRNQFSCKDCKPGRNPLRLGLCGKCNNNFRNFFAMVKFPTKERMLMAFLRVWWQPVSEWEARRLHVSFDRCFSGMLFKSR
jgi:hypothetical protein